MTAIHLDPPVWDDEWAGEEILRDDTHRYLWLYHGFNFRLVGLRLDSTGYDYGWCFRKDEAALRAHVRAWDPTTQDEPLGWHKRTHPEPRRAPRRDPHDPHNGVRCEHGAYLGQQCPSGVCHHMLALEHQHGIPSAQSFRSTT